MRELSPAPDPIRAARAKTHVRGWIQKHQIAVRVYTNSAVSKPYLDFEACTKGIPPIRHEATDIYPSHGIDIMKDFRGMKRNRGRNRKPSGTPHNNPNRAYESNGPEGAKVRGNAQTVYEKYQQLARDANSSGDRVLAENYLQHAEHYFRVIRMTQPQRPVNEYVQRDPFMNGFDVEYDDETEDSGQEAEASVSQDSEYAPNYQPEPRPEPRAETRYEPRPERNFDRKDRTPREGFDSGQRRESYDNTQKDDAARRETRRDRFERRRQQRLGEQQEGQSFAPSGNGSLIASTEPLGVSAPAFIASVEPVRPRERPTTEAKVDTSNDAAQLPAFIRATVRNEDSAPVDEAVIAKTRRPRRRKAEDAAVEEA